MFTKLRSEIAAQAKSAGSERPPWKAKTVWAALALMLLGCGLWLKDHAQANNPSAPAPASASQFSDSLATGTPAGGLRELKQLHWRLFPRLDVPAISQTDVAAVGCGYGTDCPRQKVGLV
jgi:hypothetical protein